MKNNIRKLLERAIGFANNDGVTNFTTEDTKNSLLSIISSDYLIEYKKFRSSVTNFLDIEDKINRLEVSVRYELFSLYIVEEFLYQIDFYNNDSEHLELAAFRTLELATLARVFDSYCESDSNNPYLSLIKELTGGFKKSFYNFLRNKENKIYEVYLNKDNKFMIGSSFEDFNLVEDLDIQKHAYYSILESTYNDTYNGKNFDVLSTEGVLGWLDHVFELEVKNEKL
jgi:hypothetical protein